MKKRESWFLWTEIEELRRLKFIQEVKEELITWGKRRTMIMTIVVSVIGLIGINVVVSTVIRGFVADDIKDAQKRRTLQQSI